MRFVDKSFEIIEQEPGLQGIYNHIEIAGRTCYKSIIQGGESAKKFVEETLIARKHFAMLEHGTVYLTIPILGNEDTLVFFEQNAHSKVGYNENNEFCVTTNLRVILENDIQHLLQYMCEPTEYHEKRYTVKFILNIAIVRDLLRHRPFSFANESTRYCNYSKDKFGKEITYVIPHWIYDVQKERAESYDWVTKETKSYIYDLQGSTLIKQLSCEDRSVAAWVEALKRAESDYNFLTSSEESYKLKPEDARGILPLDTKSELIMTGFKSDWIHVIKWRSHIAETGKAHPDMIIIFNELLKEFLKRDYITENEIYS